MWPKKLQFSDNPNQSACSTPSAAVLAKYGDADVTSKRRKVQQSVGNDDADDDDKSNESTTHMDSLKFEEFASETCFNSSFKTVDATDLDFKGGLVNSSSSSTTSLLSSPQTPQSDNCANLTITSKPSSSSRGLENTFKILQNQVEANSKKSLQVIQNISRASSSSLECCSLSSAWSEEVCGAPSILDLELEALHRIQTLENENPEHRHDSNNALASSTSSSKLFLTFLNDFTSKNAVCSSPTPPTPPPTAAVSEGDTTLCSSPFTNSFLYHAAKASDGKSNRLKIIRNLSEAKVLCGNRVSQMTRTYDDIEAVTRLLEEKEKDLELTVQIGKELLTQNNKLESRIQELETDLREANEDRAQLVHELHKKNELISVLTNDSDVGDDSPTFSKSVTLELLQKKIATLQDENKSLKSEVTQLASDTDECEEQERKLMDDLSIQLNEANSQFEGLSLELERQREENRLQHDQIVNLTARLAEAEMRLHQLTHDNDEHVSLLNITRENQNSLALELVEFKQRYQEVLALLQEAQDLLRKQRKKAQPQVRSNFLTPGMGMSQYGTDSLQSELMESSLYSEISMDSGISGEMQRMGGMGGRHSLKPGMMASNFSSMTASGFNGAAENSAIPAYKKVFETVRSASKSGIYADSGNASMTQLGSMSMSSASMPRMSSMPYGAQPAASSTNRNSGCFDNQSMYMRTLSCESLSQQSDDGYPAQPSGVPGAPGAKDLEAALKRLTPAEVLARRAMLSYAPVGTYNYDEPPNAALPLGIRTPDSIMSTGSSGISSSTNMSSSLNQWRIPDKLQIVKPIEGSQTLHQWSQLATPTLSGLLEDRPGVTIRGGRGLDELGMHVYTLSDVEEDMCEDLAPGKQFESAGCTTFTYTTSTVMHPDDGLVTDLSFLSRSQMSSRMASSSTSRQPSCPQTPHAGLSRKNSCSTFSVYMGLASMLNERGIKAVTPSALNTPAGVNFSPTVTPCNSPEGSPTRSMSPEPLFGLLSSGADLIRRKLGGEMQRPNRSQQHQKIMLSRLERRALRSLKLVEKVESIGLENIIASQSSSSQFASGIANRSSSPMNQMSRIHVNNMVDDIHFDRDQIKDVLQKGLNSSKQSGEAAVAAAAAATAAEIPKASSTTEEAVKNAMSANKDKLLERQTTSHQQQHQQYQSHAESASNSTSALPQATTSSSSSYSEVRLKQVQRQKSRRNLKNGMAAQRPDLGTINNGRMRQDLGSVQGKQQEVRPSASKSSASDTKEREQPQTITQAFVGSVSSLLFGRKGGWL